MRLGGSAFRTFRDEADAPDETLLLGKPQHDARDRRAHQGIELEALASSAPGREGSAPQLARQGQEARKVPSYIMLPDGQARNVWMQLQLVVAMYIIWVTPIRVGFNLPAEGMWFWVEGMIDVFFYFDLAMNFFIAYEDPITGDIIADQKKIALRYLKGWFAIDLLATFPVDYLVRAVEGTWMCSLRGNCSWAANASDGGFSTIRILRVVRIFRIFWILKHFKVMRVSTLLGGLADDLYSIMPLFSILELLVVLLYLGHFSGCFFYLFSTPPYQTAVEKRLIEEGELETWVMRAFGSDRLILLPQPLLRNGTTIPAARPSLGQDPVSKRWYTCPEFGYDFKSCLTCDGPKARCVSHFSLGYRYVTSMYWAYTTMTTVGYGDISSVTVAEKVWAIITMIGSGFFFSFVVGRMASVISKLDSVRNAHSEKLEIITNFLKDVDLPRPLSKRVLDFFKKQEVKPYDRQQVLATLPFELRSKILRHLYADILARVPLLESMVAHDDVFLTDVCVRLQHYTSPANSFLYQRGEVGGDAFILVRGEVCVLDSDQKTALLRIPEGTVFGEATVLRHVEGFTRAKRPDNVWCATPCTMLRIAQEDMVDLLAHYPELLESLKKLNKARTLRLQEQATSIKAVHDPNLLQDEPLATLGAIGTVGRISSGARRILSKVSSDKQQPRVTPGKSLPFMLDVDEAFTPCCLPNPRPAALDEDGPASAVSHSQQGQAVERSSVQAVAAVSLHRGAACQPEVSLGGQGGRCGSDCSGTQGNGIGTSSGWVPSIGGGGGGGDDCGEDAPPFLRGTAALDAASTITPPACKGIAGTREDSPLVEAAVLQLHRLVAGRLDTLEQQLETQRSKLDQIPGLIASELVMTLQRAPAAPTHN